MIKLVNSSLVVQLVYYGQNIKVRYPIGKIINYLHVVNFFFRNICFKELLYLI